MFEGVFVFINMDISIIKKLVANLAIPNDVGMVLVDQDGEINLLTLDGDKVKDVTLKELEALIFKETHPQAPKDWRKWSSKKGKEFWTNLLYNRNTQQIKSNIKFSDLEKIDIRVGLIEKVIDIEKSDKLVKLVVDFGDFKRNILVGIKKERENPKEIEGLQALFVVNLEPKEMMGEISEGMTFDIGYSDGIIPVLAIPEKKVPNGVKAG